MNKRELSLADLQIIDKAFKFGEDRFFLTEIIKNKVFFANPNWKAEQAFQSLYLTLKGKSVMRVDFYPELETVKINGLELKISSKTSVWSQLRQLFENQKQTASLFGFFINNLNAANKKMSPEILFLVSSIVMNSKKNGFDSLTKSDLEKDTEVSVKTFNGNNLESGKNLKCKDQTANGELNIIVNGFKMPATFTSTQIHENGKKNNYKNSCQLS